MNWPELLVGAVIGSVLGAALNEFVPRQLAALRARSTSRAAARQRALFTSGTVHEWLVNYYASHGDDDSLYRCRFGHYETKIPFLTCKEWAATDTRIQPDSIVKWSSTDAVSFPVDDALLADLKRLGRSIVNQPTMYLDRLEFHGGRVLMHVKVCEYLQMASRLGGLERETVRAAARAFGASTDLRDQTLSSLQQAARVAGKPFSAGCVGVIAVRSGTSWEILVQTRSHKTITYGGFKCGIPTFGMEPIFPIPDRLDHGIVTFNFLREYCEELFSYDELIELGQTRRIDPYWFYSLPEARELLDSLRDGSAQFSFVGFGFDALNGTATICILLTVTNTQVIERLRRKASANWEVQSPDEEDKALEFVDIRSPKFEQWLRARRIHSGAAYAFSESVALLMAGQTPSNSAAQ